MPRCSNRSHLKQGLPLSKQEFTRSPPPRTSRGILSCGTDDWPATLLSPRRTAVVVSFLSHHPIHSLLSCLCGAPLTTAGESRRCPLAWRLLSRQPSISIALLRVRPPTRQPAAAVGNSASAAPTVRGRSASAAAARRTPARNVCVWAHGDIRSSSAADLACTPPSRWLPEPPRGQSLCTRRHLSSRAKLRHPYSGRVPGF